jgi:hypothetical protein
MADLLLLNKVLDNTSGLALKELLLSRAAAISVEWVLPSGDTK